jgi:shikimate dehydrogenase
MPTISGATRLAGVVGWPLEHSLSPAMHNAAYDELGLDWVYVPLSVSDEMGVRRLVAAIRSLPFIGFNITMPYKALVLELCDEVATAARMAGAVNTVHCSADGRLIGYNTDGRGMIESLAADAEFDPAGKRVVIFGAGGAAGGALVTLTLAKCASITVVNRTLGNAEELLGRMAGGAHSMPTEAMSIDNARGAVNAADLVINATPVGMRPGDPSPVPIEWLREGQVVLDMVYGTPNQTALVSGAQAAGAAALDGLGMLVAQGAIAVDIWNESQLRTPRDVMRRAAREQLALRRAPEGR